MKNIKYTLTGLWILAKLTAILSYVVALLMSIVLVFVFLIWPIEDQTYWQNTWWCWVVLTLWVAFLVRKNA